MGMSSKLVTLVIALVMLGLAINPLLFGMFYLIFRPLVQPYAMSQQNLVPGLPVTGVFAGILIGYTAIVSILRKRYTVLVPNGILFFFMIGFATASIAFSWDYGLSVKSAFKFCTGIAMYILIYNSVRSANDARLVIWAIVLSSVIPMAYGYYQYVTGTGVVGLEGTTKRIVSVMGMPNSYGELLSVCFCASLILFLGAEKGWKKVLLFFFLVSNVVSQILALNRGSWIALSFALATAHLGFRTKVKTRWVLLAMLIVLIVFSGTMVARFQQLHEVKPWGGTRNTFEGRIEMWKGLIGLIPQRPILGFGIGTAEVVSEKVFKVKNWPHNDYVRLALEAGIPMLMIYLLFLARILWKGFQLRLNKELWHVNFPLLTVMLYWVVISSVQNIVYDVTVFPLFLAVVAATLRWNDAVYSENR